MNPYFINYSKDGKKFRETFETADDMAAFALEHHEEWDEYRAYEDVEIPLANLIKKSSDTDPRALKAAKHYLELQGYEILDTCYISIHGCVDIVAKLDNILAFIDVKYRSGYSGFSAEPKDREEFEKMVFDFLSENDEYTNCSIRYDQLAVTRIMDDRAILRHHMNVLGVAA